MRSRSLLLLVGHLVDAAGDKDGGMLRGDSLGSLGRCGICRLFSNSATKRATMAAFASVAFLPNLMVEARGVVTALIPALLEIVGKLVHLRRPTVRRLPFGKLSLAAANAEWSSVPSPRARLIAACDWPESNKATTC